RTLKLTNEQTHVRLHGDARQGWGPEIVTIIPPSDGNVDIWVHNYSAQASDASATAPLTRSAAIVDLVVGGRYYRFTCPEGSELATWWHVATVTEDDSVHARSDLQTRDLIH